MAASSGSIASSWAAVSSSSDTAGWGSGRVTCSFGRRSRPACQSGNLLIYSLPTLQPSRSSTPTFTAASISWLTRCFQGLKRESWEGVCTCGNAMIRSTCHVCVRNTNPAPHQSSLGPLHPPSGTYAPCSPDPFCRAFAISIRFFTYTF